MAESVPVVSTSLIQGIDAWGRRRQGVDARLRDLLRHLAEFDLADESARRTLEGLRERVAADKLVLAFVAEFSRGKSELINAIFFADSGRRILPATPGRTTMCPVELGYDPQEPPALALLPIETRLEALSLAELRHHPEVWKLVELPSGDALRLAQAMEQVTEVRRVSLDEARALGFWNDEHPDDNPPLDHQGKVEVPAWRHALINFPHPLLRQGLVVLDTPGLNAIGAEPELTLGLLPSAHAAVFILGADTGVTRSDLAVWRDHLGPLALSRFVALNKIDALADPLSTPEQIETQIQKQRQQVAAQLELPTGRVFPVSARLALTGRVEGQPASLAASRLPALEDALAQRLLPQRHAVLVEALQQAMTRLQDNLHRQTADRRRQLAEQMVELRGLRGKNVAKIDLLIARVDAEAAEFERCTARLVAMRSVHSRMLQTALDAVSSERVRDAVDAMRQGLRASVLQLGARKAFGEMCAALRQDLMAAQTQVAETQAMLASSFLKLNAEFGFSLASPVPLDLTRQQTDLDLIERNYEQYLGFSQAVRLTQPRFMEQFRRMLVSRLRTVFEAAATEIETWNKTASAQVESQLRERRRDFKRRRESLSRIQGAGAELETRLAELEAQHDRLLSQQHMAQALARQVVDAALEPVDGPEMAAPSPLPGSGSAATRHGATRPARADAAADADWPATEWQTTEIAPPLHLDLKDVDAPPATVDIALDLEVELARVVRAD